MFRRRRSFKVKNMTNLSSKVINSGKSHRLGRQLIANKERKTQSKHRQNLPPTHNPSALTTFKLYSPLDSISLTIHSLFHILPSSRPRSSKNNQKLTRRPDNGIWLMWVQKIDLQKANRRRKQDSGAWLKYKLRKIIQAAAKSLRRMLVRCRRKRTVR